MLATIFRRINFYFVFILRSCSSAYCVGGFIILEFINFSLYSFNVLYRYVFNFMTFKRASDRFLIIFYIQIYSHTFYLASFVNILYSLIILCLLPKEIFCRWEESSIEVTNSITDFVWIRRKYIRYSDSRRDQIIKTLKQLNQTKNKIKNNLNYV